MADESPFESVLHAMYDSLKLLDAEAEINDNSYMSGTVRAILRGQLKHYEYEPYLKYEARRESESL